MKIRQLINAMKKRPGMYVKEERIDYIYYLLSGYCGSNVNLEDDDINRKFRLWFWKWLLQWIEENVDAEYEPKSCYWYDDIKAIAGDEKKEVPLFYELCDMFFEDYNEKRGYFSWRNS